MKHLILGDGLLGTEIANQTGWDYISRKKDNIDFINTKSYESMIKNYDEIINCISYTSTYDFDREKHWKVNYEGAANLADICNKYNKKIIHISTDHLYSNSSTGAREIDVPVHCANWYGYTKLLADGYIQLKSKEFLIVRSTHKETPFKYNAAWLDQYGNFDYVDIITELIVKLINKKAVGIFNVGTEVKSMYELAKKSNKNVKMAHINLHRTAPSNVIMNISKIKEFFNEN